MKPKEKAKELVCKMYGCEINTDLNNIYIINGDGYFIAKDSALIAVNEILGAIDWDYYEGSKQAEHMYWKAVKQEIEKL
jgi:hypothetical protein